ncbi:MAG: hypothetical protein HY881_11595 [Deltaproteobacteria bacterium]|nr:hypothetical protein [Deltaproteobacteria bacterium]
METFAVYWEPIVKTYGISERTGLCLISLDLPFNRLSDGGACLSRIASRFGGSLILIFSRPASPSVLRLNLLLDRLLERPEAVEENNRPSHTIGMNIDSLASFGGIFSGLRVDNPVELIYFQGPHYGDRYGIAGAAVTALAAHVVPLLAVVCAGASVYLIIPEGMASAAVNALKEAFSTPETVKNPSNL